MPDELSLPNLPPDLTSSWLSRNRKIVILGGLVLILGLTAGITVWLPKSVTTNQPAVVPTITNITNTANTNTYSRPTFQRSIISNTPTTLPPVYRPPTTDDLRQAILNLNVSTSPKS